MSNVAIDTGRQWSCSICGNSAGNREHHAREMMFGTREVFSYQECGKCGCVQLVDEIGDLSRHYPADYYSFRALPRSRLRRLKHWLKAARARRILTGRSSLAGYLGSIVARGRSVIDDAWLQEAVRHGLQFGSRILDVGCGSGKTLVALQANGFRQLFGVDPFIPEDVRDGSSLWIRRSRLEDLRDDFDFIMFHHSFEHISEGESLLRAARDRVAPGGMILVRIPIVGELWDRYGVDWVQLDAPRHLYIHSKASFIGVAERCGLQTCAIVDDGGAFGFWGSEQYARDIPLMSPKSHFVDPQHSMFDARAIARFESEAQALNAAGRGDQTCFFLRPSSE
ncbi:MAG: class I SAM-dependent methyltransferase [Candidatus Velthaea sp.]